MDNEWDGVVVTPGPLEYYRRVAALMEREPPEAGEAEFWREEITRSRHREPAVDLGCGSARLARLAARELGCCVGVDLSPHMLRRAGGPRGKPRGLHLVRGDVRTLPLRPGFGLALAGSGVLGHLRSGPQRDRALAEVARILRPGGRLLLDGLWIPGPEFRQACESSLERRRRLEERPGEPSGEVREEWRCEASSRVCRVVVRYGPPGGETWTEARFTARVWEEEELRERLEAAGFGIRQLWGDFGRASWDPVRSPRLLVDARRR